MYWGNQKRRKAMKRQELRPTLQENEIRVYRDALEKHNWDVNEAFTKLCVERVVIVKNRDYLCQILKNLEIIKECFKPIFARQSNMTLAVVQASSTISTGAKEDEIIQSGGMEAGSSEQLVLAEEIDVLLSPEHRASVWHELQTMISNLGSHLKSFLPASEPDGGENSPVKGIRITNDDTKSMGPEAKFKWSHFDTALKVIQEMCCQAPSIELADAVDKLVETKIINGNYDFKHDESVVKFVERVLQYTRLMRDLFSKEHQMHKEQLSKEIESQIKLMKNLSQAEMTKIEEKIKYLAKAGSRADTRLLLLKQDLEKTVEQKKHLEYELANLMTKLNRLSSDIERYEREKNNMATEQNEIEQFVHCTLDEHRRNGQIVEEILRSRLGNLDEMYKRELEKLKMVVLRTSIQNSTSSGSKMNPILVKEEQVMPVQVKKE